MIILNYYFWWVNFNSHTSLQIVHPFGYLSLLLSNVISLFPPPSEQFLHFLHPIYYSLLITFYYLVWINQSKWTTIYYFGLIYWHPVVINEPIELTFHYRWLTFHSLLLATQHYFFPIEITLTVDGL